MLGQLRVQELKQLCKEEGLDEKGSKGEIIKRIVQHREAREAGSAPPATPPRQQARGVAGGVGVGSSSAQAGRGRGRGQARGRGAKSAAAPSAPTPPSGRGGRGRGRTGSAGSNAAQSSLPMTRFSCRACGTSSDVSLAKDVVKSIGESFLCLQCRVRTMDPFNPIVESEGSGILHSAQVSGSSVSFSLDLPNLRQWRRDGLQVELRMARFEDAKVSHVWPHTLKFSVNHKEVFRVVEPEEGHKRRDVPQVVSPGMTPGANLVTIEMSDALLTGFAFALVLTEHREPSQLAKEVNRCKLPQARARVQGLLGKLKSASGAAEEDIACLTENTLKLACPITMDRVQEPVRGENCQHLQCFSLSPYLVINSKMSAFNKRWVCPLCSLVLRPNDLRIDAYVEAVLTGTAPEAEEVTILPDGAWRCVASAGADSPGPAPSPAEVGGGISSGATVDIDLEDSDSGDEVPLSLLTASSTAVPQQLPADPSDDEMLSVVQDMLVTPSGLKRDAPVATPARPPGSVLRGAEGSKRRCLTSAEVKAGNPLKPFAKPSVARSAGKPLVASTFERAPTIVVDLD